MWRELIAVLLVGVTLHAQTKATNPDTPKLEKPVPRVETYQRYTQVRRGATQDVGIVLVADGFVTSPRSPVTGITPVSLELDPTSGFTVSKLNYPKPFAMKFPFRRDQVQAHGAGWFPIETKIKADASVPLGDHLISGKLKYQAITKDGIGSIQELPVLLPVTVVDRGAQVAKTTNWPFYHMPAAEIVGIVILCIVLLPIFLVILPFYMICMAQGKCD